MKDGVKVNPGDVSMVVLLSRQDLEDKVVPIKEPLTVENIQNLEDRRAVMG